MADLVRVRGLDCEEVLKNAVRESVVIIPPPSSGVTYSIYDATASLLLTHV